MFGFSKPKPPSSAQAHFLAWTKDFDIGIEQFDREHKHMGELINELHTLMVVKRDRTAADQLTDSLIKATRDHFNSEEELLREHGYVECDAHFQKHSELIDELRDLHRQFKAGTLSALAMPTFLKRWLFDHIQNTDKRYVAFLRSKGVR